MPALNTMNLSPWAPLVVRIVLGIVFIAHGGQKLFGLWGGSGFMATVADFEKYMGIPPYLTAAAAATEFFGGAALLAGLLTRPASAALATVMVVAIFKAHLHHGFFINWEMARGRGHGIEFNLALIAMCVALMLSGPGKWALDRWLGIEKK